MRAALELGLQFHLASTVQRYATSDLVALGKLAERRGGRPFADAMSGPLAGRHRTVQGVAAHVEDAVPASPHVLLRGVGRELDQLLLREVPAEIDRCRSGTFARWPSSISLMTLIQKTRGTRAEISCGVRSLPKTLRTWWNTSRMSGEAVWGRCPARGP